MSEYQLRVPIVRLDEDGMVHDGTAQVEGKEDGGFSIGDFRFLDGMVMPLPAGSMYQIMLIEENDA